MEFHGSYGGQWLKNKSIPIQKESKRQNKDMILTASKSENESELQHFAGQKAA